MPLTVEGPSPRLGVLSPPYLRMANALGPAVGGLATQLRQTEDSLVELGGLCRIVSRQRDVFDPCHGAFLSHAMRPGVMRLERWRPGHRRPWLSHAAWAVKLTRGPEDG
jgi:hypothetical protein